MTRKRLSNSRFPSASRKTWLGMILGGAAVVVIAVVIRTYSGTESANADSAQSTAQRSSNGRSSNGRSSNGRSSNGRSSNGRSSTSRSTTSTKPRPATSAPSGSTTERVIAVVQGQQITRKTLGDECLRHHGKKVLELVANKVLIAQECKRRGIVVTSNDVDAEIDRMAKPFGWSGEQWLAIAQKERGIKPSYYRSDVIWQLLALRRLAGSSMEVTQEDMTKAYEKMYGSKVVALLIACRDAKTAESVRAKATAKPDEFGKLAKEHSIDASASIGGVIQPISRHGHYENIEQAAFTMKDGEVSKVIPAGGQYVIIKRQHELPGQTLVNFQQVAPKLREIVRADKSRGAADEVFQQLQDKSQIINVLNDPAKSRTMPGVAAMINGYKITKDRLAQECILRHGTEVLEGIISRKLIELACKKRNIKITEADLEEEIQDLASQWLPLKKDGKPDVETWLAMKTQEHDVSVGVYRRDAVWPTVALKKLVGKNVVVTEADIQRGFEANYGPKVRCLAIILNDGRRAQRVWQMAQANRTEAYFAELARQYSTDPGSKALGGKMPPIRKHGGQPTLEEAAFSLSEGELSGIIQVDRQSVILWCLGQTTPTVTDLAEVREIVHKAIFEKKQQLAMTQSFERLQEMATIENRLSGSYQSPKKPQARTATKPSVTRRTSR